MIDKLREGLSFDDVLLIPLGTEITPDKVDTSSLLIGKIVLQIPVISSPMDTVTEARMAIAMAREGSAGVIHRNMSIEQQAAEVDKVKRSEHGIIVDPISLSPNHTIREALALMEHYHISGVPITDDDNILVGILTNRDTRFETQFERKISEVMTSRDRLVTATVGTTLAQAQEMLHTHRIEKLPLTDDAGHLKGLITIKDIQKVRDFPKATKDSRGRLVVGAAVGPLRQPVERSAALAAAGADFIVVDSAHGHSRGVLNAVTAIKTAFPGLLVIAGNVATKDGTKAMIDAGVDAIRVGIGAGSICTTRVVAGVGVPQLTAVVDCAEEAAKHNIPTIADGGLRLSGDMAKALAGGASAVMVGNALAGTEEAPGEVVLYQGRSYKEYRGMGSIAAMQQGSSDRYYQDKAAKFVPEGVEGRVPYKGPVADVLYQMVGGIRSGMGYLGAHTIAEMQEKAQFIKISAASLRESHPHDVWITKEPPNYSSETSQQQSSE